MPRPLDEDDADGARGSRLRRWGRSLLQRGRDDEAADADADADAEQGAERAAREAAEAAARAAEVAAAARAAAEAAAQAAAQAAAEAAARAEAEAEAETEAAAEVEREAAADAARAAAALEQEMQRAAERQAAQVAAAAEASRQAAADAEREAAEQQAADVAAAEEASRQTAADAEREAARRQAADVAAAAAASRQTAVAAAAEAEATARGTAAAPVHVSPPLMERPAYPLPHESVLEPWSPGPKGGRIVLDKLDVATNRRQVTAALVEGINAEGPIHIERLGRLIAASFDIRKLSPGRVTDIAAVIPKSTVRTEDGTVCWPARVDPATYVGFRSSSEPELRPTEHIPRHELANAMRDVVDLQGPTPTPELFGITRRIFGGKRVTANVEARMTAALDEAVSEGRLTRDGDIVRGT